MNNPHLIEPAELATVANGGALGPSLARATLPLAESQDRPETGPQTVIQGLRTNPNLAAKVLREIEAAVEATTAVWDSERKKFVDRADFKTRLSACELFLAYGVGLPVQRSENLNINAQPGQGDGINWSSPVMRDAVRRMLEKADREAAKEETARRAVGRVE